ncbi:MAG: hypothetical protein ABL966_13285, partial [Acidimicrobiales bacterium]
MDGCDSARHRDELVVGGDGIIADGDPRLGEVDARSLGHDLGERVGGSLGGHAEARPERSAEVLPEHFGGVARGTAALQQPAGGAAFLTNDMIASQDNA